MRPDAPWLQAWEVFKVKPVGDGKHVHLMTWQGTYLRSIGGLSDPITASGRNQEPNSEVTVVCVEGTRCTQAYLRIKGQTWIMVDGKKALM